VNPRVTIGLDLARKTSHQAAILDTGSPGGPVLRKVNSSAASLDAALQAAGGPDGCVAVLEPTGMAWLAVAAWLVFRGCTVVRTDTRRAHDFRKVMRRDVKSDAVDAVALARLPLLGGEAARGLVMPEHLRFALDQLLRLRAQLVKEATRQFQFLVSVLEAYVPELPGVLGEGEKLSSAKVLLLRRFLHPGRVVEAGVDGLTLALEQAGVRLDDASVVTRWHTVAERAWSIWGPLEGAGCCPVDFDVAQIQVDTWLGRIEESENHIRKVEDKVRAIYKEVDPDGILETVPGLGPVIAPFVLAVVGDIRRFPSAKTFVSWCGLAPRKNQTGGTDRGGQRISKAGNRLLRKYLYLAAESARRSDLDLASFYARKEAQGTHHTAIVTALAAKLARRIYAVLKRAAAGDTTGYRFTDQIGAIVDRRESRRLTGAAYPSKAARRRAEQERRRDRGATPPSTGQSSDSPRGLSNAPVPPPRNPPHPGGARPAQVTASGHSSQADSPRAG